MKIPSAFYALFIASIGGFGLATPCLSSEKNPKITNNNEGAINYDGVYNKIIFLDCDITTTLHDGDKLQNSRIIRFSNSGPSVLRRIDFSTSWSSECEVALCSSNPISEDNISWSVSYSSPSGASVVGQWVISRINGNYSGFLKFDGEIQNSEGRCTKLADPSLDLKKKF